MMMAVAPLLLQALLDTSLYTRGDIASDSPVIIKPAQSPAFRISDNVARTEPVEQPGDKDIGPLISGGDQALVEIYQSRVRVCGF